MAAASKPANAETSAPAARKIRRRRITPPASFDSRAADAKLVSLAASQHGLLTRAQAIAAGMSATSVKTRVRSGRWERRARGVYAIAGSPKTRAQEILLACLASGPEAMATSYTAAELHGLTGIFTGGKPIVAVAPANKTRCPKQKALAAAEEERRKNRLKKPAAATWNYTVNRRSYVTREGVRTVRDCTPTTSVAWTYVELADTTVPEKTLTFSVLDAIRRELLTVEELEEAVAAARQHPALEKLRRILASPSLRSAHRSKAEIVLEDRLLADGYSDVIMNKEFARCGIRIGEPDALSEAARLIVEVDGPGHDSEAQQSIDRIQTRCYQAFGYAVVRLKPEEVGARHLVRARIADAQKHRRKRPISPAEFLALWRSLTDGLPPTHIPSQQVVPSAYARMAPPR